MAVSKTVGCGFDPCLACQTIRKYDEVFGRPKDRNEKSRLAYPPAGSADDDGGFYYRCLVGGIFVFAGYDFWRDFY